MIVIGISQIKGYRDIDSSLKKIEEFACLAKESNVDLLIFPEMCMGVFEENNTPNLMSLQFKKFVSSVTKIASANQIDMFTTVWEPSPVKGKPYNSVLFIEKSGNVSILYRKIHLFDSLGFRESDYVCPGNKLPRTINYKGFKISVSICYDLRFPELYIYQAISGTEISIVCSAWYRGILKEEHLLTLLRARAIENTMYLACANLCGKNFCGRSAIFDPYGVKLIECGEQENIIFSKISKQRIQDVRNKLPCLNHKKIINKALFNLDL